MYKNLIGFENYDEFLLNIKDAVNNFIQSMRDEKIIGSSLESEIDLYSGVEVIKILHRMGDDRRFFFMTSRADLHNDYTRPAEAKESIFPGLWITGQKSIHPKCARCWNHCPEIGLDKKYPEICYRCIDVIYWEE